jgi:hypothetical protein
MPPTRVRFRYLEALPRLSSALGRSCCPASPGGQRLLWSLRIILLRRVGVYSGAGRVPIDARRIACIAASSWIKPPLPVFVSAMLPWGSRYAGGGWPRSSGQRTTTVPMPEISSGKGNLNKRTRRPLLTALRALGLFSRALAPQTVLVPTLLWDLRPQLEGERSRLHVIGRKIA